MPSDGATCSLCEGSGARVFQINALSVCSFCVRATARLLLQGDDSVVASIWPFVDVRQRHEDVVPKSLEVEQSIREWMDSKSNEKFHAVDNYALTPELFGTLATAYERSGFGTRALVAAGRMLIEGSLGDRHSAQRDAALRILLVPISGDGIVRLRNLMAVA